MDLLYSNIKSHDLEEIVTCFVSGTTMGIELPLLNL